MEVKRSEVSPDVPEAILRAFNKPLIMSSLLFLFPPTLRSPFWGAYASSKAALDALSNCMKMEMKPFGVDVTLISPGFIRTEIIRWGGTAFRWKGAPLGTSATW